jgi:hypothetical protein
MLTADYQEFANRAPTQLRDNTVICGFGTRKASEIGQTLRYYHATPGTKAELSAHAEAYYASGSWNCDRHQA